MENIVKGFDEFINESTISFKVGDNIQAKKDIEEDVETWIADDDNEWDNDKGDWSEVEIIDKGSQYKIIKQIDGQDYELQPLPIEKDWNQRLSIPGGWLTAKYFKKIK